MGFMFRQTGIWNAGPTPLPLGIVGSAGEVALLVHQFATHEHHLLLGIKGADTYSNGPPHDFHQSTFCAETGGEQAEKNQ
jgi:hypothetical protein